MREYSHAIPIDHGLSPGPLWPWKHTESELKEIYDSDPFNASAQQGQDPIQKGGSVFEISWFQFYEILPPDCTYGAIFCDTALKDKEKNDFTVFEYWIYRPPGKIYLVDWFREKIKSIDLENRFIAFWNACQGTRTCPTRAAYIEDKSSGIELIQRIQRKGGIPVIPIPRIRSKYERAENFKPWIQSGCVYLPLNHPKLNAYLGEHEAFRADMSHKNDDQIDPELDAIEIMLAKPRDMIKEKVNESNKYKPIAPRKSAKIW